MARQDLVICGFEQGLLATGGTVPAEFDNVFGQCKATTAQKRTGSYSLWLDYETAGGNAQGDLYFTGRTSTTKKHKRVKFWLRLEDPGSGYGDYCWLWQWGVSTVGLRAQYAGGTAATISLWVGATNYGVAFFPSFPWEGLVELYWLDDASPKAKVYLGGSLVIDRTDAAFNIGATETYIHFGMSLTKGLTERLRPYMDDFWVMAGDAESDTIPDPLPKIVAALPNAEGDTLLFTTHGSSYHYQNVDDAASASKDDTDYNESGTGTDEVEDLYDFQSCASLGIPSYGDIKAVQASCIAKVTAGSNGQPSVVVLDSPYEYTTNVTPSSDYSDGAYVRLDTTQPYGGADWTQPRLDAFQAGMRRGSGASAMRNLRLTSIMLMIAYQELPPHPQVSIPPRSPAQVVGY